MRLIPKANKYIIIPAIILHDIGWSQISQKDRLVSYFKTGTKEEYFFRLLHQCYGVQLANEILTKSFYPDKFIGDILTIISQHDTRKGFFNLNDAIVRDADKLWRYSREHFLATVNNRRYSDMQSRRFVEFLGKQINKKSFFLTEEARQLARSDFKNLRNYYQEVIK